MTDAQDQAIADQIVAYHRENGIKLPSPSRLRKKVADYKRQLSVSASPRFGDTTAGEAFVRYSKTEIAADKNAAPADRLDAAEWLFHHPAGSLANGTAQYGNPLYARKESA